MSRLAVLTLSGLGLVALSSSAFTTKKVATGKCPPLANTKAEYNVDHVMKCSALCLTMTQCLGYCYHKSNNKCRLFHVDKIHAMSSAKLYSGFIMYWAETPKDFQRHGTKAYKYMDFHHSVTVARSECQKLGCTLMVPRNAKELTILSNLTLHKRGTDWYFRVGLNDEADEGVWREDANGKNATYLPWLKDEPDNIFYGWGLELMGAANCGEVNVKENGLVDVPCADGTPYICEMPVA